MLPHVISGELKKKSVMPNGGDCAIKKETKWVRHSQSSQTRISQVPASPPKSIPVPEVGLNIYGDHSGDCSWLGLQSTGAHPRSIIVGRSLFSLIQVFGYRPIPTPTILHFLLPHKNSIPLPCYLGILLISKAEIMSHVYWLTVCWAVRSMPYTLFIKWSEQLYEVDTVDSLGREERWDLTSTVCLGPHTGKHQRHKSLFCLTAKLLSLPRQCLATRWY